MDAIALLEADHKKVKRLLDRARLDDGTRGQDPDRAVRDDQGRADPPRDRRGGDLLSRAEGTPEGAGHRPRGIRGAPRRRSPDGRARGARRQRRDVGREGHRHEGEHRAPHRGRGRRDVPPRPARSSTPQSSMTSARGWKPERLGRPGARHPGPRVALTTRRGRCGSSLQQKGRALGPCLLRSGVDPD